jgi:hypothetical protein
MKGAKGDMLAQVAPGIVIACLRSPPNFSVPKRNRLFSKTIRFFATEPYLVLVAFGA